MNTIEKFNNNVMHTYGRYPLVMEKGKDRNCVDENGKKYIDFGSGIGKNSLGYCNDKWVDYVCSQACSILQIMTILKYRLILLKCFAVQRDIQKYSSETAVLKLMNVL